MPENIQYLSVCTWKAYRLSTRYQWRGHQQLSPHEPVCEDANVDYQCEWMRALCILLALHVHHCSPIEGSVRLMLQHLIEIFKGFHLSCCLKVTHNYQLATFFAVRVFVYRMNKTSWKITGSIFTLVSESLLVTVGSERISAKQKDVFVVVQVFTLWGDLFVLNWANQLLPLSEYLWPDDEWTSMNLGRFSSRILLSCRTASLKR